MKATDARTRFAVCADDFGWSAAVNDAALELASRGRVSALSCMSTAACWRSGARQIRASMARVEIGLHLTLTEPFTGEAARLRLPLLVARAYGGCLDRGAVRDEIRRQLDAFEDAIGAPPHFIDGHRHVHQLPGVRDLLIDELQRRHPSHRPWLRSTRRAGPCREMRDALKHGLIEALGDRGLRALAQRSGFWHNRALLGVYDFGAAAGYGARLRAWLAQAREGDLLMCHPAAATDRSDPIATARCTEFATLRGEGFGDALHEFGLHVARLAPPLPGTAHRVSHARSPRRPSIVSLPTGDEKVEETDA